MQTKCKYCGKEFRKGYDKRRKYFYCSNECYMKNRKINKKPNNTKCLICNKEFRVKPSVLKYGRGKYCSTICHQKGQRKGQEMFHTNYYEHVAIRASSEYQKWRLLALKLHSNKCDKCGIENYNECEICRTQISLHVHHIEPFSSNKNRRFDPSNSSVLCPKCHRTCHANGVNSVELCKNCHKRITGILSYASKRKFCSSQCYWDFYRQYRAKPGDRKV